MMGQETQETIKKYLMEVTETLARFPLAEIARVVGLIEEARQQARHIFIFGNGGSAATASHFASDLYKGAICRGKPRIKALALTDNMPLFSAWANDAGYADAFAEQMENLVEAGDIVIAISGSGKSPNILKGIATARAKCAVTIGFTGYDGGKVRELADICIIVPSHTMRQIEDSHLLLAHVITHCLGEPEE